METIRSIVNSDPINGFQELQGPHLDREEKENMRGDLIKRFSALGQKFQELDILKGRAVVSIAFALINPTAVAVAAKFFNFKIAEKNKEIEKEIEQSQDTAEKLPAAKVQKKKKSYLFKPGTVLSVDGREVVITPAILKQWRKVPFQ